VEDAHDRRPRVRLEAPPDEARAPPDAARGEEERRLDRARGDDDRVARVEEGPRPLAPRDRVAELRGDADGASALREHPRREARRVEARARGHGARHVGDVHALAPARRATLEAARRALAAEHAAADDVRADAVLPRAFDEQAVVRAE